MVARVWLRGLEGTHHLNDSTNDWERTGADHALFCFYFFTKLLNWTFVDQQVTSGTWDGNHQATDTDGSFSGADYKFTIASGKFGAIHVGQFIVIKDPTNEENSGIYEITGFTDANNITIDFLTTAGNFPLAGGGCEWWLLNYGNMPTRYSTNGTNNFFVVQSPNATYPVTMRCQFISHGQPSSGRYNVFTANNTGLIAHTVPGTSAENWDGGTHDWTTLAVSRFFCEDPYIGNSGSLSTSHGRYHRLGRGRVDSIDGGRLFAFGHDDGTFMMMATHMTGGTGVIGSAFVHGVLSPLETTPAHDPLSLICTSGPSHNNDYSSVSQRRGQHDNGGGLGQNRHNWDRAYVFDQDRQHSMIASWQDWNATSARLFAQTWTVPNEYTGDWDALPIYVFKDPYNHINGWAPVGFWDPANIAFANAYLAAGSANLSPFGASLDKFYWSYQVVSPWPGWPRYY